MARLILGLVGPSYRHLQVDHHNRDRLDNRRENLRAGPSILNRQNTGAQGGSSRFRGVYYDTRAGRRKRWAARVMLNGVKRRLGYFSTELEAAHAVEAFRASEMPWVHPDNELP